MLFIFKKNQQPPGWLQAPVGMNVMKFDATIQDKLNQLVNIIVRLVLMLFRKKIILQ